MREALHDQRVVIPLPPPKHVPRERLIGALDEAGRHPLTLVAAGPGSGKTVLCSDWARARRGRTAWVSLDGQHNDPAVFVAAVAEAFEVAGVERMPTAEPMDAVADATVTAMLESVVATADPAVLILDDAHVVTDPDILGGIDTWLRRRSERLRLVLAARSDPLLPLHRYRLAGAMAELRAAELAMSHGEARQLLDAHGVRLTDRHIELLTARTEGWLAGLRLCAMTMEGAEHADDFVTDFALDESSVGEYLIDEVLDRLDPETRRLLIQTSFLDEVDGDLAEAVTGMPDAGQRLDALGRTNSFVLPVDRAGTVFRYHQLMAEILRYLLRRDPAHRRRDLGRRAARWYETHGDLSTALRYACDAGDWAFVVRALAHGGLVAALARRAELPAVDVDEVLSVRDDAVGGPAARLIVAAALLTAGGQLDLARARLDEIGARDELPADLAVAADVAALTNARARLCVRTADEAAGRIIDWAQADNRPDVCAAARLDMAMVHFYAGSHGSVEAVLRSAAADAEEAQSAELELECFAQLAHVNAFWSRFRTSTTDEHRANMVLRRNPQLSAPATLLLAAAERELVKGDFASAAKAIRRARRLPIRRRDVDLTAEIAVVNAMLSLTGGHVDEALAALDAVPVQRRSLVWDYRLAAHAAAMIRSGRAAEIVSDIDSVPIHRASSVLCLARAAVHLELGQLDAARAAIRPILTASGLPSVRPVLIGALVVEAVLIRAEGADADESEARAVESLVRALELADGDIAVPFIRAFRSLADVISRHPHLAAQWPVTADQVLELDTNAGRPRVDGAEALTDKERAVLRWLATSMSTSEIATELGLSTNTVKTHIAAIYRKLAAPRRRDAVLRARRLELM